MILRLAGFGFCALAAWAQGPLSGIVTDAVSGRPIARAAVEAVRDTGGGRFMASTDTRGRFAVHLQGSGTYSLRASAAGYQSADLLRVPLGQSNLVFRLRPLSDVWERGQYNTMTLDGAQAMVPFYGPDLDLSRETTIFSPPGRKETLPRLTHERVREASPNTAPASPPVPSRPIRSKPSELRRLDEAIAAGRLLRGDSDSAFDQLAALEPKLAPAAFDDERRRLRTALEDRGMEILNRYLDGDDVIQTRQDCDFGARLYEAARSLSQDDSRLQEMSLFFQARVATFDKNYPRAQDLFKQALELDPSGGHIYTALGTAFLEQNELPRAAANFTQASQLLPSSPYPLHLLAITRMQMGDFTAAEELYGRAITLAPGRSYLYYNLGVVFQREDKTRKAFDAYRHAVEVNGEKPAPLIGLGSIYAAEGHRQEAAALYRRARAKDPQNLLARHNLALLLSQELAGQAEAIQLWRSNLDANPGFFPSRLSLAQELSKMGKNDEALAQYKQVIAIRPDYTAARIAAAQLAMKSGHTEDGLSELEAVVKLSPGNAAVWELTGDARLAVGRKDEARLAYQHAVELALSKTDRTRVAAKLRSIAEGR